MSGAFRRTAVIMAGGVGERFWPLSRPDRPKQLLRLIDSERSMLEQALDRLAPIAPPEQTLVVTGKALQVAVEEALVGSPARVIAEPAKRNTSGALAWTAAWLLAHADDAEARVSMAVVPSDHQIAPPGGFSRTVETALEIAEETGALVTIGIRPSRPETGYGYIETDPAEEPEARHGVVAHRALCFREKPDAVTAQAFVVSGRFLWNSGMFFWTLGGFLREMREHAPEIAGRIGSMADRLRAGDLAGAEAIFAELPDVSIDYALMEKARHVRVVEAAFEWDDVGAWDALERFLPMDARGNVSRGSATIVEGEGCIAFNATHGQRLCLLGMEGVVVVATDDAILICPKSRAQDVRRVVEALRAEREQ